MEQNDNLTLLINERFNRVDDKFDNLNEKIDDIKVYTAASILNLDNRVNQLAVALDHHKEQTAKDIKAVDDETTKAIELAKNEITGLGKDNTRNWTIITMLGGGAALLTTFFNGSLNWIIAALTGHKI